MGNSYSVAQEEQEEAEFERLVRAVERAQRGESPVPRDRDLEAQYRYGEPEEGPPRSEKVMMWFKANRGNHATIQAELEPSPVHPVATPAGEDSELRCIGANLRASFDCVPTSVSISADPKDKYKHKSSSSCHLLSSIPRSAYHSINFGRTIRQEC
ncbi:hypothetical protein GSI_09504 [Ganoderma sinense ZZ0214-1]|uniref:Uncharacterized protein n=1 Tax=Ganoderma sinense ZZ0214-1 TaxID=1077348 RepID=A0A2G8S3J0_9APHY|nr:hypothetical protein GSI_09504 [Ganoderma sinense ZZ0214-1]